jgi:hypothetical protein
VRFKVINCFQVLSVYDIGGAYERSKYGFLHCLLLQGIIQRRQYSEFRIRTFNCTVEPFWRRYWRILQGKQSWIAWDCVAPENLVQPVYLNFIVNWVALKLKDWMKRPIFWQHPWKCRTPVLDEVSLTDMATLNCVLIIDALYTSQMWLLRYYRVSAMTTSGSFAERMYRKLRWSDKNRRGWLLEDRNVSYCTKKEDDFGMWYKSRPVLELTKLYKNK